MKDSKFIELLNLYVDHQITAEDAALLEAEIQRSPDRRRIYREYCQMQKACSMLAENFRPQVAASGKVIDFPRAASRKRLQVATYVMGGLAAAACVALVLVERSRLNDAAASQQFAATSATAAAVVASTAEPAQARAVEVAAPASSQVRPALQPAFAGLVRDDSAATTSLASSVPLDWMNRVQLQRVPTQEFFFQSQPAPETTELIFRSQPPSDSQAKMAAFRFQR